MWLFFRQSGLETMADVDDGESFIRMCLSPSPANSVEQVTPELFKLAL